MLNDNISETTLNSFVEEAILFFKLRHRNILTMYGLCNSPKLGIVMKFAPLGSLFSVLHSKDELPWKKRITITRGIAQGLQYLHDNRIIHRDLKSANVLLTKSFKAKLSDCGLAPIKQDSTTGSVQSAAQAVGTLPWMAPELFTEHPVYTVKVDVYSLGIVLWEVATRDIPWKTASPGSLVGAVLRGQRPSEALPDETPAIYKKYMALCWFQEPDKRPKIDEVVNQLENCKLSI